MIASMEYDNYVLTNNGDGTLNGEHLTIMALDQIGVIYVKLDERTRVVAEGEHGFSVQTHYRERGWTTSATMWPNGHLKALDKERERERIEWRSENYLQTV